MKYILCIILLISSFSSSAHIPSRMDSSSLLTTMPFTELFGGVIVLKIQVDDGKDSLNFIFDTGNSGISLDSTVAIKLGFELVTSNKIIRGVSGSRNAVYSSNHSIHLPSLDLDSLQFHILDYELLSSVYGMPIDGIIGYSFISQFIININYETHVLEVYKPGNFIYPKGGFFLLPEFSIFPIIPISLKDSKEVNIHAIFDIGAGLNLLVSSKFADQIWSTTSNTKLYETQIEGLGGKKMVYLKTLKKLKLGPYTFRKVPVHIFNDENDILRYPILGGILGNDLLRRFNIILNYPDSKFYLTPNKNIYEPFDYTYSGLSVAQDNQEITVIDIVKHSPADIAGLEIGDQIIYINHQFVNNIQSFNKIFRTSSRSVKLGIIRNQIVLEKIIVLKDIRQTR